MAESGGLRWRHRPKGANTWVERHKSVKAWSVSGGGLLGRRHCPRLKIQILILQGLYASLVVAEAREVKFSPNLMTFHVFIRHEFLILICPRVAPLGDSGNTQQT